MKVRMLPWWVLLALLLGGRAWGVPLNEAQLVTLKQNLTASPDMATFVAEGNTTAIAAAYNTVAVPEFWAWRTTLSKYAIYSQTSPTGSTWSWAQFKGLTVQEQATWLEMFQGESATTNYALPNIRAGVTELFAGAPANVAQKTHIDALGRRLVTRAERLYVTGTGTPEAPGLLGWEGPLTYGDVGKALALP
jgi:hypothetical protein